MARAKKSAADTPQPTTAQRLGTLIKSARQIMRKDKGLSTDLDRLPLLTWVMFLKFLDDVEQIEESRNKMRGEKYRPAIEPPYRWRDWAANEGGITGPELLAFVSQEEAMRPDGQRGPGLLTYLRGLAGGSESSVGRRRRVIATVFNDVTCRMLSGYLLRDVINKVNGIHFLAKEELFTLGHLYETMLREMRDAAGENGEFYTPRAVVKFMVTVTDPRLGETVLDPASGTGGFLVEAFTHLEKQCKTVADRKRLQEQSIYGAEAKPLSYPLCQMNLLLHGLEAPQIDPENSLRFKLTELGDRDRFDVIVTNPPFGGEEEAGIKANFPSDMQTAETALLFLQLIMRRLRRPTAGNERGGRAAVVVPHGTLFGDGVGARIKEQLLKEFNLHTVVRLPNGVFSPYTLIPTNILFFDRSGPTKDIWYYEIPPPAGRKGYTKTQPMTFEDFAPCIDWWNKREPSQHTWKVKAADVLKYDAEGKVVAADLDIKNPNTVRTQTHRPATQIADSLRARAERIVVAEKGISEIVADVASIHASVCRRRMADLVELREPDTDVAATESYQFAGVYCFGRGVFGGEKKTGVQFSYKRLTKLRAGDFVYPKLMAWEGAFGVVPESCDGFFVSTEFPVFSVKRELVLPEFLAMYFRNPSVWLTLGGESTGTNVRRRRLNPADFLAHAIALPAIEAQRAFCAIEARLEDVKNLHEESIAELRLIVPSILDKSLGTV